MEKTFCIQKSSNQQVPQISLMGDFDLPAASQLLESIEESEGAWRIVVRTECVTQVESGSAERLSEAFSKIGWLRFKVCFCGVFARKVAPRGALVYL